MSHVIIYGPQGSGKTKHDPGADAPAASTPPGVPA
jgi:hypothetical protein